MPERLYKAKRTLTGASNSPAPPAVKTLPEHPGDAFLRDCAQAETGQLFRRLGTSKDGLDDEAARLKLRFNGPNEVFREHEGSAGALLWATVKNPLVLLLLGLAAVSFVTDNPVGGIIVSCMVVLSVALTFFQEFRSSQAAARLKDMISTTVTVLRRREDHYITLGSRPEVVVRCERLELPLRQLVPGDLVSLSAGDMIPGDLRLLSAKDFFVSQSALTGEALPLEKHAVAPPEGQAALEACNLCFMGSNVISGTAQGVVLKTGEQTYLGSVAQSLASVRELSGFELGVNRFTFLMLRFMLVMAPLVLLINGFGKGDWFQAAMFALAVAVGLTPEMLPMIVSVNLARGALAMSRKKVIVKRLNAIQNFGAMDVLCTDKTGTLTQDKVVLLKYMDPSGFKSERVLQLAFLNSQFQTGLKNLLDLAVLAREEVAAKLNPARDYRKVDEIPFDFGRRRMSVVVEGPDKKQILICKGALEELFKICDRVESEGELAPLDDELAAGLRKVAAELNEDGMRVITVAYKEVASGHGPFSVADESGLTLVGYLAFLDPPKADAAEAIAQLRRHGIQMKVLTGDNDAVTRKVCGDVGIDPAGMLLGSDLEGLDTAALQEAVGKTDVFAKLNPAQKERIVRALRERGHVVGFMGDGINDAPALRAADIGLSVDNAVDVAKESADIIMLEKSLLVLDEGVLEGRQVFGNILKYIRMGASSNFGNVFSILGASFLFPFLPMLPLQILAQNLLYDLSQTAIPFDRVDDEDLAKPRKWDIDGIGKFMLYLGPVSSLFDYATFAVLWFALGARTPAQQGLFQAGWFVEGLLSQTLIVHVIRTRKIPFVQSRAAWPLLLSTVLVLCLGLWLPFSPLGRPLGFNPLPAAYFGWLLLILVSYALLAQWVKGWAGRQGLL
jgi:Mg2+-importing ATPase